MARKTSSTTSVKAAFEGVAVQLAIADIQPLRLVTAAVKGSVKYAQITASIREVGIIEPPVVARDRSTLGKYLLLDGHLRLEALKDSGTSEAVCIVTTDDEALRVNRIAIIQEHRMILKAIERGASEERIAKALNIDVKPLQYKKRLLTGICSEAVELLKDRHVPGAVFWLFKR